MEAQTDNVKVLLDNDNELYLRRIQEGPESTAAPFRAEVQAIGAALSSTEAEAALISDLLSLAWEVGRSEGIAGEAVAFEAGWLMGYGERAKALEKIDTLPADVACTIEGMSNFKKTAKELRDRIVGPGGADVVRLGIVRDDGEV